MPCLFFLDSLIPRRMVNCHSRGNLFEDNIAHFEPAFPSVFALVRCLASLCGNHINLYMEAALTWSHGQFGAYLTEAVSGEVHNYELSSRGIRRSKTGSAAIPPRTPPVCAQWHPRDSTLHALSCKYCIVDRETWKLRNH